MKRQYSIIRFLLCIGTFGCANGSSGDANDNDSKAQSSQGDFDIGDVTEISEEELRELVCAKLKECDPQGYEEVVEEYGECLTEVDQLLENCVGYLPENAAKCLAEARLSDLADFHCPNETGVQPDICIHICESTKSGDDDPLIVHQNDDDTDAAIPEN